MTYGVLMTVSKENAKRVLSRRDFLKGVALGGALAAVANFTPHLTAGGQLIQAKVLSTTAAELFKVRPNFERFDPRYTAFSRSYWDKSSAAYGTMAKRATVRLERVRREVPGYSLRDHALSRAMSLVPGFGKMNRGFYSWDPLRPVDKLDKYKVDPAKATKTVKRAAKYLGADLVGICLLDRRWVYSHTRAGKPIVFEDVERWYETEQKLVIPESHRYVVVLATRMSEDLMRYAPLLLEDAEVRHGYDKMQLVAGRVAEFIRQLGYHAIPMGNDTALSVPLAIDAGIGQYGRITRLVTPEYGPLVRLAKVFTDLPMTTDKPIDFGLTEFCNACMKCVDACPVQALPRGPPAWEGPTKSNLKRVLKWQQNPISCLTWWAKVGTGCAICFRVCPWSKGIMRTSTLARSAVQGAPALNSIWRTVDDALGYGALRDPEEFWREE
ncbi:MAG: reductive dehalogenase [Candidatus Bathyarchaeia archaeon]